MGGSPAVVLDFGPVGIGLIHALGAAGVEVVTVAPDWPPLVCFGRYSRWPRRHVTYAARRGESLAGALLRLGAPGGPPLVVFPSTDDHVAELLLAYDRLAPHFHLPVAPALGLRVFEKNWQYAVAERVGVPTPRFTTFLGGERPDVREFAFPLIVKPSARLVAHDGPVFRLRLIDTPAALERCVAEVARAHAGRAFQVAEDIPGPPDQLYTIGAYSDRQGRVRRTYSGRKLSQHPYSHGHGSICETLAVPDELIAMARALLEAAGVHGISQVEFKFDARDGRYKLIEINPRAWSWVKLAVASGVNLPLIQYYDLTGDRRLAEVLAVPQDNTRFFINEYYLKLNHLAAERECIRALARRKVLVGVADGAAEWRLRWQYTLAGIVKGFRQGGWHAASWVARPRGRGTVPLGAAGAAGGSS